ncbi:unnamed protein product [Ectocarpus fasciculatus]
MTPRRLRLDDPVGVLVLPLGPGLHLKMPRLPWAEVPASLRCPLFHFSTFVPCLHMPGGLRHPPTRSLLPLPVRGPTRRGRGRPRKDSQAPPVPKRRRGRPPNVRPDTPSPNGGAAGSSPPADAPCPPALHTPDATEPGSSRSTPAATLRRGPGRPGKQTNTSATPVRICPTTGDKVDDLLDSGIGAQHDFSLTISARNSRNVESDVFEDVDKYLQERMVRGLVSLERGNVHGNLHLQGILTAGLVKHFDDPRKEEAAMRKSIRQACEWKSHVKVKIVINV